jgi:hypothetical protein
MLSTTVGPSVVPCSSTLPPSIISISGRAGHAFEPHTMVQGYACHSRGVEIKRSTSARVEARVRSKRAYDVELVAESEPERLVAACSCPARTMGMRVCKHVWAALLEVDRCGGLDDLRKKRGKLAVDPALLAEPAPAALLASQMTMTEEAPDAPVKETIKKTPRKTPKKMEEEEPPPKKKKTAAKEPPPPKKKSAKKKRAR